ncbi:MAG: hypothetical protein ABI164_07085 [Acidobacteriaceae bacterium]
MEKDGSKKLNRRIAVHMSNLAYRQKRRVTLEEAMAAKPEAWM